MRVFVTGATGFIGSAVVHELLGAGHEVTGLARSDAAAAALTAVGAQVHRGSLADPAGLAAAAAASDGVIHTAYIHDFTPTGDPAAAAQTDGRAIEAMGEALAGSGRPLVVASGIVATPGRASTEADDAPENPAHPRVSEHVALPLADRGVRVTVLRLPPTVHGAGDHGFVPFYIAVARDKGLSAYLDAGANRWATVHRLDAAVLARLTLEGAPAGTRVNAVGEEGVAFRDIAEAIGRGLDVPVKSLPAAEAAAHFGPLAHFASYDVPASSAWTQERFGWRPAAPGLLADLAEGHYFGAQ